MKVTINNKSYFFPDGYKDITFSRFKDIQKFIEADLYKDTVSFILKEEGAKMVDEEVVLNFFIDFINFVTDIPKKDLKRVRRFTKDDLVGIEDLFYYLSFLFTFPIIDNPKPANTLKGYYFIDVISLDNSILKDASFIDYTEANSVSKAFNNIKDGKYEYLAYLLAILYRPKEKKYFWSKEKIQEYDYDEVMKRSKEFEEVDMDSIFNCLFFFMKLKTKLLKNIEQSFVEEMEKVKV